MRSLPVCLTCSKLVGVHTVSWPSHIKAGWGICSWCFQLHCWKGWWMAGGERDTANPSSIGITGIISCLETHPCLESPSNHPPTAGGDVRGHHFFMKTKSSPISAQADVPIHVQSPLRIQPAQKKALLPWEEDKGQVRCSTSTCLSSPHIPIHKTYATDTITVLHFQKNIPVIL